MTYADPNRSLALPSHSHDIFDVNCHPDLDALIALKFPAHKMSGPSSEVGETKSILGKVLLGILIGVPFLSYVCLSLLSS